MPWLGKQTTKEQGGTSAFEEPLFSCWTSRNGRANLKHLEVPTSIANHRTKKISFFLPSSKNMIKSGLFRKVSAQCPSMEETEA